MSDPESTPLTPASDPPRPNRLRRFFLRHVPITLGSLLLLIILAGTGLYFWMSSSQFQGIVLRHLITTIEQATGGRVEIGSFHWRLLHLEAEADNLVIHGSEAPGEAPYLRIDHLAAGASLLGFWSPSVRLSDLSIVHPVAHLITYADGTSNQPHPHKPSQKSDTLSTLFDLEAGRISLQEGYIDYDNRAASFDFQNRHQPLDFQANDVSVLLSYVPWTLSTSEAYRIQASAADLNLTRTPVHPTAKSPVKQVRGYFQATLDLTRTAAYLRSLRITGGDRKGNGPSLQVSGSVEDFTHPHWQAKVLGDLDMRLLDPVLGYPSAPEGLAHLNLAANGQSGQFKAEGNIHVENGSYIGTGVVATGLRFDAYVHADPARLLISSIVIRLRQGGQMEGAVDLSPWLSTSPVTVAAQPEPHATSSRTPAPPPVRPGSIPMNGKVNANFKNVTLDTILDMVSAPPFQRLGIGAIINGPAVATWTNGDVNTVSVIAGLKLSPPANSLPGEAPANGIVNGTYTQGNGSVDLRRLELNLPESQLVARGNMGAHPLSRPSLMTVDFHTKNLGEFDTILRSLGLNRNGKSGVAALPVAISGQADYHGTWTGSLANPHLIGELKATDLAFEMPAQSAQPDQPQSVHLDSVEAAGNYTATRIAIDHAVLLRGNTKLSLSGVLAAAPGDASPSAVPVFDLDSLLQLHLDAANVATSDVQPFLTQKLPVSGTLATQVSVDGPIRALGGSGWLQLENGTLYGEPVQHARAQGTIANEVITLDSIALTGPAGNVSATGNYDIKAHRFQVDAKSSNLDMAKVNWLAQQNQPATGHLSFAIRGSGTFDDPQLSGNAALTDFAIGGESVGGLQLTAHTANHALVYDLTTKLETAELTVHGQTDLRGDYQTQAKADFSHFDIDSLLKLAHVKALNGQSALAGTITISGPLAHIDQLRGEARLQELEATVVGVHLKSEGGVHATLANNRISLDPLHVTGEDTDLRAQGTLALNGTRQLDLAASGSVNLKLAETLDPDITASGTSTFQLEAHGPIKNPGLQGRVDFQNGALAFEDIPNGLSQLHGTLVFNQDRLEVKTLTAMSGGGPLTVGGYLAYQHGIYADLSVTGKGVRIRYPQGVSSLADATLHLQGPQNNLQLSGNVLITRFTVSPDLDFAALAAQANSSQTIASPDAPTNHIRLDVRISSSPQLNFQNAFAKLAGDVDLRLRGTVATPSLQGRISITEGSAMIAGTRYELQRGDIAFTNPMRIEPSIDLSATARVQDYDITLNLHGTPSKMSTTMRSDPPLPESDVVALLALGRTENQQRIYTQQQEQALSSSTTDSLLGGALNATVSSRIQKLFGAGSVKVDPNYLGPFGNSTSRIIVEEQVGRNLTLTYATDVNTTGQQLLQAEIAINRHVSLLVARDESGVFSMVVKATRRFR